MWPFVFSHCIYLVNTIKDACISKLSMYRKRHWVGRSEDQQAAHSHVVGNIQICITFHAGPLMGNTELLFTFAFLIYPPLYLNVLGLYQVLPNAQPESIYFIPKESKSYFD